jgi:long-chain acyl-CoA synthetase
MNANLASILAESASRFPGKPGVTIGDRSLDYATLDDLSRRFAGALGGLGVRRGDHVALLLPNVPHFTVAYFGCHYAAAPVVPLNVLLSVDELAYQLTDSGAAALVVAEDFADRAAEALARVPGTRHLIVARADLADLSAPDSAHNLTALVIGSDPVDGVPTTAADDTAVILYTSGTTGRPKGAELTHANVLSNVETCGRRVFPLGDDTVALVALPLFHAFGQTVMHNAVLRAGGELVLMPRWDPGTALDLIERHRVTFFGGVPTMYVTLLRHPRAGEADVSSLRICVSGGAPLPAEVMAAVDERFGADVLEGYGLSETSPVVAFNPPGRPKRPGSVGLPIPGVEVQLVDEDGRVVTEPDTPGEIWVRGPNVMKGYLGNPEAAAEAITDGWFHTGDVGTRDTDGYYRVVDRKKDMILRGGFNVYPREVEDVLCGHPDVVEAAVVGAADDRYGEEVVALVVLRPGASATGADLKAWCRERLASYKYPRRVEVVESLPHGPTGKVLKRELRRAPEGLPVGTRS